MRRRTRERILDGGTGLLLIAALALLVEARVLPAWRARSVVEVGEEVPEDLAFRTLTDERRLRLGRGSPTLLLVFLSDCPACRASAERWRSMARRVGPGVRALAVALEPPEEALAYARGELAGTIPVAPRRRDRFLRILAVEAVPATLFVGPGGRLLHRRMGTVTAEEVEEVVRIAASASRRPAREP